MPKVRTFITQTSTPFFRNKGNVPLLSLDQVNRVQLSLNTIEKIVYGYWSAPMIYGKKGKSKRRTQTYQPE